MDWSNNWNNKVVLITGGAGSLGSALVQRLLHAGAIVRVYSRDELKHHRLKQLLAATMPADLLGNIRCLIGDVRDLNRLRRAMHGVDVVYHLAALKHVGICQQNPLECMQTNVGGSMNVVEAAIDNGVKIVIGASTDKAVAPNTTYGASKLAMEYLLTNGANYAGSDDIRLGAVRMPNIADTSGNVFEIWQGQTAEGKPLGVTDRDMERPFTTRAEAVESLIQAAYAISERPAVYVAAIGMLLKIGELAERWAQLFGLDIQIIGWRPGDRLSERMTTDEERTVPLVGTRLARLLSAEEAAHSTDTYSDSHLFADPDIDKIINLFRDEPTTNS